MAAREQEWTPERVAARLQNLGVRTEAAQVPSVSPQHQGYRMAAAVLAWFEPTALHPCGPIERDSLPPPAFLAECIPLYTAAGSSRWCLEPVLRKAVLRQLVELNGVEAALSANPKRPDEPLQRLLEDALHGKAIPADQLAPGELPAALQVAEWLDGVVPGLPSAELLRRRLELEELLKPLRRLTGEHFRGRTEELEMLRRYTGVHRPLSLAGRLEFAVHRIFSLHERPPLVIHGPGGMGKSTLLARFILEHIEFPETERFPFVYLDFDHPSLTVEEPLALLAEMFRQLGSQYPAQREMAEAARRELLPQLRGRSLSASSAETLRAPVGDLVALLRHVSAEDRPFLLVLDTFEEVQYTARTFIGSLFRFLDMLQNAIPRLRTVLAGRSPITEFKSESLELGDLDRAAAEGFLAAQGLKNERLVKAVAAEVGGNPLSLKLAAEVARKEGTAKVHRSSFLFRVREEQVQGQLYRRILGHIHDEEVRKLAHPGLVLRVVTPELITEVLAKPCGIPVPDAARAQALFDQLRRESSLVTVEGGVLRHRQDVRRVMIDLLRADKPEQVTEIHRKAVEFHAKRGELLNRAEEIYHRLALGEEPASVAQRWIPEVAPYLRGAVDELPPRQRAYLASRLGLDLDEKTRAEADLVDWERDTEKRVQECMFLGEPEHLEKALKILGEREERTQTSHLFFLEAQILERLDRLAEAREVAENARHAARVRSDPHELLSVTYLLARLSEREGRFEDALRDLEIVETLDADTRQSSRKLVEELEAERSKLLLLWTPAGGAIPPEAPREPTAQDLRELLPALTSALPTHAELARLLQLEFNVRLEEIALGGSLSSATYAVLKWAESRGRLSQLIAAARKMNPKNPSLAAVAAKFWPHLSSAPEVEHGLPQDLLLEVHKAAVTMGLIRDRERLFTGLNPSLVAHLPLKKNPQAQLLSDLTELNRAPQQDEPRAPLRTWLRNAADLSHKRQERTVFLSALDKLDDS